MIQLASYSFMRRNQVDFSNNQKLRKMEECRYFIVKCASIQALQRCADSGIWACRDRVTPPHPRTLLSAALQASRVILIYSVNNCHGWHGYAEMLDAPHLDKAQGLDLSIDNNTNHVQRQEKPRHCADERNENIDLESLDIGQDVTQTVGGTILNCLQKLSASEVTESIDNLKNTKEISECKEDGITERHNSLKNEIVDKEIIENQTDPRTKSLETTTDTQPTSNVWYHFQVKWQVCFIKEFGEQCLSIKLTENFKVSDTVFLNKTRNWQEIPADVGAKVCSLIDEFYQSLCEKQQLQAQKLLDKQADPFFKVEDEGTEQCEETWRSIVHKIEGELGQVILACPFGSQRYNLSVPSSDTDMFIVYQARTKDLLSFHPPKQTIKNSERESCDYTIHEAYRYSELLLSGDARCVETLFLHELTVVKSSRQWEQLKTGRHHFINQETLNKYRRDAQGTRGTKQLKRWCEENPSATVLSQKMCKLLYVIVRLLQNARDIVQGKELCVYRENESSDRATLMKIRQGDITVEQAWETIRSLEQEIEKNKEKVPEKHKDTEIFLEDWLINLRKSDFLDKT